VGCLDGTSCPADKQICDAAVHSCRGCIRDDECPGGICVEADGACVGDSAVVFVDNGGGDGGTCTRAAPCHTLGFAISRASTMRDHIKILSGTMQLTSSVLLTPSLYIEGNDTIITGPSGMFGIAQSVNVTLSHMKLEPTSGAVVTIDANRTLRLVDVQTSGGISVNGGGLEVDLSTFMAGGGITCTAGTTSIRRSVFDHSPLSGMTCQIIVRRTRFDIAGDGELSMQNSVLTFENNLVIQSEGIADSMSLVTLAPGSAVRFNTFVNTDGLASDGLALYCDTQVGASSNIFAYVSLPNIVHGDRGLKPRTI
jgi:hypothetical protein